SSNALGYHGSDPTGMLGPTDTKIDIVIQEKDFFSGKIVSTLKIQNKATASEAIAALSDGKYKDVPILVPRDVFQEMKGSGRPEILNAIKAGKLIDKAGQGSGIETEQIERYTKNELQ